MAVLVFKEPTEIKAAAGASLNFLTGSVQFNPLEGAVSVEFQKNTFRQTPAVIVAISGFHSGTKDGVASIFAYAQNVSADGFKITTDQHVGPPMCIGLLVTWMALG